MSDRVSFPIENYRLEVGSPLQRARLVKFMQRAYRDMAAESGAHLADTVQRHLSPSSQVWWLVDTQATALPVGLPGIHSSLEPVGCLWLTEAIDQRTGEKQAYVFLLYVAPAHRHKGLATAMMRYAHHWSKQQGYKHISLQVFEDNAAAMNLYTKLGYQSQAKWMSLKI
ncbi:MAG: GNAT family N-acetyltransferase [Phormidesmis sp.]